MTKFNVGDKVRVVKADTNDYHYGYKNGDIFAVNDVYSQGVIVNGGNRSDLRLHRTEIELVKEVGNVTKYKTEKRKARVGERILITDAIAAQIGRKYMNGDVLTVTKIGRRLGYPICGVYDVILHREYEVIVGDETLERLSEAEAEIATLKAKVAALEAEAKPKYTYVQNVSNIGYSTKEAGEAFAQVIKAFAAPPKKTPNQRRADVIKRAQAFVADLEWRAPSDSVHSDGNRLFNEKTTKLSFHVNAEKRVVTALAHGRNYGKLHGKAFAHCAPDDVFNADIGKAIAAGRLYGVEVPEEFTDAVKPTEAADGQIVTFPTYDKDGWYRKVQYRINGVGKRSDDLIITKDEVDDGRSIGIRANMGGSLGRLVIIDDSDAVYE